MGNESLGDKFSETSPDAVVVDCDRGGSKAKKKGWDVPCVLKLLCKQDKNVVQDLGKLNVQKFDRIQFMDHVFDGTKWVVDPFEAGGTAQGNTVTILSGQSCEDTATTLFHERWHTTQPASMNHCDKEREAYTKTEEWTVQRGFGGQGGLRTKDSNGNDVPDKKAIEAVVRKYPGCGQGQTSNDPIAVDFDDKTNQTLWEDPVSKTQTWMPSQKDDRVDGKRVTTPTRPVLVPKSSWKCP